MRKIKITLPFKNESVFERKEELIKVAQILSNNKYFSIIDEKHLSEMSYIVIYVVGCFSVSNEAS